MFSTFTQEVKPAVFKILDKITAPHRHLQINRYLFQQSSANRDFFILLLVGDDHLMQGVLEHFPALFDGLPFSNHLRPFN